MKKNVFNNEGGFTLIEIIAVLIILGILASVAIPKYMDTIDEARRKSGQAAICEVMARCSNEYAKQLLLANGDRNAVDVNTVQTNVGDAPNVGPDYGVTTAVDGDNIVITVNRVQNEAVSGVSGNWIFPIYQEGSPSQRQ